MSSEQYQQPIDEYPIPPQPQEPPFSPYFSAPSYHMSTPTHSAYILQLTNHDERLEEFYMRLLGLQRGKDGALVKSKYAIRLINEKGAEQVVGQLSTLLNDVTTLSNFTADEIKVRRWINIRNLCILLSVHRKDWDVYANPTAYSTMWSITCMFDNYQDSVYKRSDVDVGVSDKKFFRNITQEQTMKVENTQGGGSGWLSKLNPWRKS